MVRLSLIEWRNYVVSLKAGVIYTARLFVRQQMIATRLGITSARQSLSMHGRILHPQVLKQEWHSPKSVDIYDVKTEKGESDGKKPIHS